jgi:type II secretory ATPase GspE/PulE/Tfp pilus assembly ATPase PilB-like protein
MSPQAARMSPFLQVFFAPSPGLCVVLGELDHPALSGFPGLGLLAAVALAVVATGCVAATIWIDRQGDRYPIPAMDVWRLAIAAATGVFVAAAMRFGPLALPLGAIGPGAVLWMFTRQRDTHAPSTRRILTRDFRRNLKLALEEWREEKKNRAAAKGMTLGERVRLLRGGPRTPTTGAAAAATPKPGHSFTITKKDGRQAFAKPVDGDEEGGLSENVQAVRRMLMAAMRRGATDIHFEPHENDYHVRFRIDGVLQQVETMPLAAGRGTISALKVAADMDIAERRRPQDGTFSAVLDTVHYDIRAASTPTSYGEKMVMRVLQSSGGMLTGGLGSVGLRTQLLEPLREVIHKPYGMFLVTGPTGSGKTTTVYASLSEIDAQQHNITTIEDPVEYRLDGITQIAVNTAAGVTFASILRSVLRQDPDVLLVGEIRDKETAEIACQAALTGHFVFSTLHANDTVATITRMLDLGLDAMLIQTALTAVLAQRLARKLCMHCREPYPPPADLLARLGIKPGTVEKIYRERDKGCEQCGGTGYKGRIGLHELLVMNDDIRRLITPQPSVEDLRAAARHAGTRSLQTDGLLKVMRGVTSVKEVVRVTT